MAFPNGTCRHEHIFPMFFFESRNFPGACWQFLLIPHGSKGYVPTPGPVTVIVGAMASPCQFLNCGLGLLESLISFQKVHEAKAIS